AGRVLALRVLLLDGVLGGVMDDGGAQLLELLEALGERLRCFLAHSAADNNALLERPRRARRVLDDDAQLLLAAGQPAERQRLLGLDRARLRPGERQLGTLDLRRVAAAGELDRQLVAAA